MTSSSFPYLAIARRNGVDYGAVLRVSEHLAGTRLASETDIRATLRDAFLEIEEANYVENQRRKRLATS